MDGRIMSQRRSENGAGLGRPHSLLPPVMMDLERDGTLWDWIMASLRQAGTGILGREDKGLGINWQRYAETLIAAQSPLSSLNLTRRSEYTTYQMNGAVGLGIVVR